MARNAADAVEASSIATYLASAGSEPASSKSSNLSMCIGTSGGAVLSATPTGLRQGLCDIEDCIEAANEQYLDCVEDKRWWDVPGHVRCAASWYAKMLVCGLACDEGPEPRR